MRRSKLGDVYAVKVSKGYRLIQYAFHHPRYGQYIRVFDGVYASVPKKVDDVVSESHSYMITFKCCTLYCIGLAERIGNYPVPEKCGDQDYRIRFWFNQKGELFSIWIMDIRAYDAPTKRTFTFEVHSIADLPEEYRNVTLVNSIPSVPFMLYLLDCNFSLDDPIKMEPHLSLGQDYKEKLKIYDEIVAKAREMHK